MKNFVIATVSAVALLGSYANATTEGTTSKAKEAAPVHQKVDGKKAAHHGQHAHKHHAHKHHGHRHHAHKHDGHALAVFVNYPLVNVAAFSACPCEYYQSNKEHAYIWHEGYFWYPHSHAGMLPGYTPHQLHGSFWYPSRLHPHMVYIDRQNMMPHEVYPVQIGSQHEGGVHHHHHHKGKMKHHGKKTASNKAAHKHAAPTEEIAVEEISVEEIPATSK